MAKDEKNQGGPTRSPKDEPTEDRDQKRVPGAAQTGKRLDEEGLRNKPEARGSRRTGTESGGGD